MDITNDFTNDILEDIDNKKIHLRIQKRNARKCITFIHGICEIYDKEKLKSILKELKKQLSCNGSITQSDEEIVMKFSGDHRDDIKEYLLNKLNIDETNITVHGY